MYEETGHKSKEELIAEAKNLVSRLTPVVGKMRANEAEFIRSMGDKLKRYDVETFVSPAQLFWMRDLDERYVPDPRQAALF
jgi:hypothetical protein